MLSNALHRINIFEMQKYQREECGIITVAIDIFICQVRQMANTMETHTETPQNMHLHFEPVKVVGLRQCK